MAFYPGDVVIRRSPGASMCSVAVVLDEGVLPAAGLSMGLYQAWDYASRILARHGQVYELGEDDHPYSN